jgi:hypothetical protein
MTVLQATWLICWIKSRPVSKEVRTTSHRPSQAILEDNNDPQLYQPPLSGKGGKQESVKKPYTPAEKYRYFSHPAKR